MCSVWQKDTDVIIDPQVGQFAYDAFEHSPEMIKMGAEVTRKALPQIKSWLAAAEAQAAQAASVPVNLPAERSELKPAPGGAPMPHPAALPAK